MKERSWETIAKALIFLGLGVFLVIYIGEVATTGDSNLESGLWYKLFLAAVAWVGAVFLYSSWERDPLRKSLKHLRSNSNYFWAVTAIFFGCAIFGYVFANQLGFLDKLIEGIFAQTLDMSGPEITAFIFLNNTLSSLIGLAAGIFEGIPPLISTFVNGVVLGFVLEKVGILSFWKLIPHGIFELPAVFVSLGLGLKIGWESIRYYFQINKRDYSLKAIGLAVLIFFPVMLLLGMGVSGAAEEGIGFLLLAGIVNFLIIVLFVLFMTLFVFQKRMRIFVRDQFYNALMVFVYWVVPVLALAAVIEGLLITFL